MARGIIDSLLPAIDSILGVRDDIGAVIQPVYLVTRTWSGTRVGDGTAVDEEAQVLPSPGLKTFAHDVRIREGGAIKQGDIILQNVSKNRYIESDLDGSSTATNVEKFFRVGDYLYQSINVAEKYVTFDVQIRRLSSQERFET
jgi:hypothetical protein